MTNERKLRYSLRNGLNDFKNGRCITWEEMKEKLFDKDKDLELFLDGKITHEEYCLIIDTREDRKRRRLKRSKGLIE